MSDKIQAALSKHFGVPVRDYRRDGDFYRVITSNFQHDSVPHAVLFPSKPKPKQITQKDKLTKAVGPKVVELLLSAFGGIQAIVLELESLTAINGIGEKMAVKIITVLSDNADG